MKKLLTVLLAVMMLCGLAGCGAKENPAPVKLDASAAKAYSMDLSNIEGYEDYVVTDGTWAETYDEIIALSKKEADAEKRTALYHAAEDLLMDTGCIVPIYYYTDLFMLNKGVEGYFSTPLGMKYFTYTTVDGATDNISINLSSEPDTIDPAAVSAVDGGTIVNHMFAGLIGRASDGSLVPNCAKKFPVAKANEDGTTTYVFELKDGLVWSDGEPLKASDFEYAWKRASMDCFDYGYLFEVIDGYDGQGNLNVTADDDKNTLTVVLPVDVPYFFELCAFQTYAPVRKDCVGDDPTNSDWAVDLSTYIGNGAYVLDSWTHDSVMVFKKNDKYWDAKNVTMQQITNYLSDDDVTILGWYKDGTCNFIDSVPNDEIATLKADYPDEFIIEGQLGTYYVIFNNDYDLLPAEVSEGMSLEEKVKANNEIRKAISLIYDRNYVVEEIGQAGQLPASSFVSMGITNADGSQFYETAGGNSFPGYYDVSEEAFADNCAAALETLSKYYEVKDGKLVNFPTITYLYNTGTGHQSIGEYLQSAMANYGITTKLENQEWATFLQTRKDGNFTIARNGWLADYNDAISYLDMWTTVSGNNDAQFGK